MDLEVDIVFVNNKINSPTYTDDELFGIESVDELFAFLVGETNLAAKRIYINEIKFYPDMSEDEFNTAANKVANSF